MRLLQRMIFGWGGDALPHYHVPGKVLAGKRLPIREIVNMDTPIASTLWKKNINVNSSLATSCIPLQSYGICCTVIRLQCIAKSRKPQELHGFEADHKTLPLSPTWPTNHHLYGSYQFHSDASCASILDWNKIAEHHSGSNSWDQSYLSPYVPTLFPIFLPSCPHLFPIFLPSFPMFFHGKLGIKSLMAISQVSSPPRSSGVDCRFATVQWSWWWCLQDAMAEQFKT